MSSGASFLQRCPCAIATKGVAGPDGGTQENPIGTDWIAVVVKEKIQSKRFLFSGNRQEIVQQSSYQALQILMDMLE